MKIVKIPPEGVFMVNCFLVVSGNNNAVLIDAPCGAQKILNAASANNAVIKKILLTHGHCDHIESLNDLVKATGAEVYIHQNDISKLKDPDANLSGFFTPYFDKTGISFYGKAVAASDGDIISLDDLSIEVMHTPGHTSGCVCFINDDVIFSGDTLFKMSIGRTDMPDGDTAVLMESLKKLAAYKGKHDDYKVFAGHGEETSLAFEICNNSYMK